MEAEEPEEVPDINLESDLELKNLLEGKNRPYYFGLHKDVIFGVLKDTDGGSGFLNYFSKKIAPENGEMVNVFFQIPNPIFKKIFLQFDNQGFIPKCSNSKKCIWIQHCVSHFFVLKFDPSSKKRELEVYDSIEGVAVDRKFQEKDPNFTIRDFIIVEKSCGQQKETPFRHCAYHALFNFCLLAHDLNPEEFDLNGHVNLFKKFLVKSFFEQLDVSLNENFLKFVEIYSGILKRRVTDLD